MFGIRNGILRGLGRRRGGGRWKLIGFTGFPNNWCFPA